MATKTATNSPETKNTATSSTETFRAAAEAVQGQYFSMMERGQEMALGGLETLVDVIGQLPTPTIPSIPGVDSESWNVPSVDVSQSLDTYFDFAAKALDNQRQFASKSLALLVKN